MYFRNSLCRGVWLALMIFLALAAKSSNAQSSSKITNAIWIAESQGKVEVFTAGATAWSLASTNQILHPFERLRTGPNSRVALRWSDQSVVPFGPSTELEILPPHSTDAQSGLHLIRGIISFFHRDKPGRIRVITRGAVAGVEGTEFVVAVSDADSTERTTLSVVDGRVSFANDQGTLVLTNGEQAVAEVGKAPIRTAGFIANNLLQWCFYYPAVLDPSDLPLTEEEKSILSESLSNYRDGDLLGALAKYPSNRQPASDAEKVFYAALLLSVGEVNEAQAAMNLIENTDAANRPPRLASALRRLIAAVKREPMPSEAQPDLTTELLASSYYEQSSGGKGALERALKFANQATEKSPELGFAWARVAELEFSFGRFKAADEALSKSLALSPRNAEALALKGFVLMSQNQPRDAIQWFDRAIAVDSALGNAWLGRGLSRIRRGDIAGGREDILIAAALEPQRALLRSYLGKAYATEGDRVHAIKELDLSKKLDPNDPTAWLYSALLNQEYNQINDAIRDLEESKKLNDNRSVYRSRLLLDQDQAVRSANLAAIYRDAGMTDLSIREASRAVNTDYANYSAHLFLASSYEGLRDTATSSNYRYEKAVLNEYLLANLLAPAAAGTLSPIMAQQNSYAISDRNRLGLFSSTEYLSRGAWMESGVQYGIFGNLSYGVEAVYRNDPGQRANSNIEERILALRLKQQLTPQDSVYVEIQSYDADIGDIAQRYDPNLANLTARSHEEQEVFAAVGYHHEWSPGVHTMLLLSRLPDHYSFDADGIPAYSISRPLDTVNEPGGILQLLMTEKYRNELVLYSAEIQQLWQTPEHNTIVGTRFQYGCNDTFSRQTNPSSSQDLFDPAGPPSLQDLDSTSQHVSVYGYHQWYIQPSFQLIGGVSYDWRQFPENLLTGPISTKKETADQVSPKAGFIWTPTDDTVVRFAYTRSLGSQNLDQSIQLEPSQVAGFIQSFRGLISDTSAQHTGAARFETFGLSLEKNFSTGTYLAFSGEILNSNIRQTIGQFAQFPDELDYVLLSGMRESLDSHEQSFTFTANQLLGKEWALGAQYRLSYADLDDSFPELVAIPGFYVSPRFYIERHPKGLLHNLNLYAVFNHSSGFFAKGEGVWFGQDNQGDYSSLSDDYFWQFNAFVGYRFPRRRVEAMIGLLNIGDQDYRLSTLNLYSDLPRERTVMVRFQLNF